MRKSKLEELRNYIEELKTIEILDKRDLKVVNNEGTEKSF